MCTVLLPPCVNQIAVNKYIDISTRKKINQESYEKRQKTEECKASFS